VGIDWKEPRMLVRNLVFGLAAGSLVAAPLAATPGSSAIDRKSAPVSSDSEIGSSSNSTLFFVLAILAVAAGIYLLIDDDDEAMSP
jgi:hypothetical protein